VHFGLTVKQTVKIFGQDMKKIYRHVKKLLDGKKHYKIIN